MAGKPPWNILELFVFIATLAQLLKSCSAVSAVACVNYGIPSFGDLNGNKKTDLICNVVGQNFHAQFRSKGNGKFTSLRNVLQNNPGSPQPGWCTVNDEKATWVDINGDGLADVSCDAANGDHFVRIWLPGSETFTPHVDVLSWCPLTAVNKERFLWTDVDGDGRADMICEDKNGLRYVQLTHTDPILPFAYLPQAIFDTNWCRGDENVTVWGDLNADGLADVACHDFTTGNIAVQFGNGDGGSTDQGLFAANWCVGSSSRFALADINGDGHADFLCTDDLSGNVKAILFLRMDIVDDLGIVLTNWCISATTEWKDLNGDGKADIVCVRGDYSIQSRRSLGNGLFDAFQDVTPAPTAEEANATEEAATLPTISQLYTESAANRNLANREVSPTHALSFEQPVQVVCSTLWAPATEEAGRILVVYYNHSSQRGFYDTVSPGSLKHFHAQPSTGENGTSYFQELPGLQRICDAQEECNVQCSMTSWPKRLMAFSTAIKRAIVWSLLDNIVIETERTFAAQEEVFGFVMYNDSVPCALISENVNAGTVLVKDVLTGQQKWSFVPSGRRPVAGGYVLHNAARGSGMLRFIIAWRRLFSLDAPLEVFLYTIDSHGMAFSQRINPRTWPRWFQDVSSSATPHILALEGDSGDVAIVRGTARSVTMHWVLSDKLERSCCSDEDIAQVLGVSFVGEPEPAGLENRSINVLVQTSSGLVKSWMLSDDNDIVQYRVVQGKVLNVVRGSDMNSFEGGLLVIGTNNIAAFENTPKPRVYGVPVEEIYANLSIVAVFLLLTYCILFNRKSRSQAVDTSKEEEDEALEDESESGTDGEGEGEGEGEGASEEGGASEEEGEGEALLKDEEVEKEASNKRSSLSLWATLMTCIGMQSSISKFTVYDVPGYEQEPFSLCPERIRRRRNVTCYRTHCILTLYLCFITFTFSPNILGRFVGPAASTTKGKVCDGREEKLSKIQTEILGESNYSAGEIQVSELQNIALGMRLDINSANSADPQPFPNFPLNASDVCGNAEQAKLNELYRQIDDDSCMFETEIIKVLRDISIRDYFLWIEVDPVVQRIELPPLGQRGRQCPIDASLLDDIEELKRLMNKNFQAKKRQFVDTRAEVEQAVPELLKTLMFQANMAADVYIFYVCLCLLVRPPLRLSRSKLAVRIKRTWFHWQQIPFVFYFTLAAYFVPIIWRLLNLDELFRLLKNASVDLCFVQPSFIADVSQGVYKACNDIEELRELFNKEIETIRQLSQDARAYFLCVTPPAPIEVLLNNLEEKANATADAVFESPVCGSGRFDAFVGEYSNPELPDGDTTLKFLLAILTLTQIFGKFVLVNFGLSVTKYVDPLSFHGGKIEVIETSDTLMLPHVDEVTSFLRRANSLPLRFHILLAAMFFLNMTIVLDVQTRATAELDYVLFCVAAFILTTTAVLGAFKFYKAEINGAIEKNERAVEVRSECMRIAACTNARSKLSTCKSWVRGKCNELRQRPE